MDGDTVQMGGGFTDAARASMSDQLRRRLATQGAHERQEAAREEHRRSAEAEQWRERSFQLAAQQAIQDGEAMIDALAGRNLGNTPQEFINKVNAQTDYEDAMAAANQQRAFRRWQLAQSAATSADTSDHEHATLARRQETDAMRPGVLDRRQRRSETREIARAEAVDAVRVDRRLRREGFGGI